MYPLEHDIPAMHALFGNPDANNDGAPDPSWVANHLTTIVPPYKMYFSGKPVLKITCNKAIAQPLLASLQGIIKLYGTQEVLEKHNLHLFGGVYNFRTKRIGGDFSTHGYAAAIDLDPNHNLQGKPKGAMPLEVVAIFEKNSAEWGGHWSPKYRDPMHFQWARTK